MGSAARVVVDGSVVMVENALRRLAERRPRTERAATVLEACAEVARPILFGVGIIIVVYLPILTLQGVEGKLFTPMAVTVVLALAGSLLLTFTLTPVGVFFGEPGKEVQIQVYTFPPAASVPWHIHPDTHEFGYQLGGEFTLMINGEASRVLKPGDAFYVPPNAIHRGVNAGREAAKFMVVRVRPKDKPADVQVQP